MSEKPSEEQQEREEHPHQEDGNERTEKIWKATRNTWNTATTRAAQYKKIVQKKIDLASIHRKIDSTHSDLGRLIDEARDSGEQNILDRADVRSLLNKLDGFKHNAATLEHEIEMIKTDQAPAESEPRSEESPAHEEEKKKETSPPDN